MDFKQKVEYRPSEKKNAIIISWIQQRKSFM